MIDYHLHVWPHEPGTPTPSIEQLCGYAATAEERGLQRIAITEHSHRFVQVDAAVGQVWAGDDPLSLKSRALWVDEQGADLDAYCNAIGGAQDQGLAIELGIEVDLLPNRVDQMVKALAPYRFDVRLGSVHWLGAWLFDAYGTDVYDDEWDHRGIEQSWRDYETSMAELVEAEICDVLAHCDLIKVAGQLPDTGFRQDFAARMVDLVAGSGLAVEVSSAGWRKLADEQYPSRAILEGLCQAGVEITLSSDAHVQDQIAWEYDRLLALVADVGFRSVVSFPEGVRTAVPLN